jgi:putative thioredoxin
MDMILGQKKTARPTTPAGQGLPTGPTNTPLIIDGDQATFMEDVIDASREVPVLVDFWATWCQPCKQLTPALERVVTAAGGRLRLVKIDVDANRALVSQLGQIGLPMQSIPTVAAFWQGQIADMFQGALPESEIRRFAEALLKLAGGAMPAAELVAEARAQLEQGQAETAAGLFSQVLEQEPENAEAWGGMARAMLALGEDEEAAATLERAPAKLHDHPEMSGARSAIALAAEGRKATEGLASMRERLSADPLDHAARYELATALNATGARQEAADALLEIIRLDRSWNEGAARLQLIRFFEAWGHDDAVTLAARRRLSSLLFS